MELPIMWILFIAGLLFGILAIAKAGNSKKTGKVFWILGGIGIVLGILSYANILIPQTYNLQTGPTLAVTPGVQPIPSVSVVGGVCPPGQQVEDTTVTLSAQNKYTAVATGGTHRYRVDGSSALTVSDAGTFTASPGNVLDILYGNETSGTYYGEVRKVTVPCRGTFNPSEISPVELVQNGTLTIEVFNEEGNLILAPENETLASGDVVTLTAKLKGTYQRGFPHGGVMVAEFNGTGSGSSIDDVIVSFGGSAVSVPSIYSITLGTQARTKAFSIPSILSNQILEGSVVIDADDNNDPTSADDVILTFYPNDYFINEDTGGTYDGPAVADEDSVQTFAHSTAFTLSVD